MNMSRSLVEGETAAPDVDTWMDGPATKSRDDDVDRVSRQQQARDDESTSASGPPPQQQKATSDIAINTPPATNTQLPTKRDSASSYVTAADRASVYYKTTATTTTSTNNNSNSNSNSNSNTVTATHGSKKDAMGSLSMARIAEEASSSSSSSSALAGAVEPQQPNGQASRTQATTVGGMNDADAESSEVLASTSGSSDTPPPFNPRPSSSSSLASSSSGTGRRKQNNDTHTSTATATCIISDDPSIVHPVQTTITSPSSPPAPRSPATSPRMQHSTLASSANEQQQNNTTRSVHSISSRHSPIPPPSDNFPSSAFNGDTASSAASSSTPRLYTANVPMSTTSTTGSSGSMAMKKSTSSKSSIGSQLNRQSDAKEVFKKPLSSSPSSSPVLPPINGTPAYPPQSHSSPNLQQQQQQQQYRHESGNVAGVGTGEAVLRAGAAPARYSLAGFPSTHPPMPGSSGTPYTAAAMQSQRSSAPVIPAPSLLPPNAYGYHPASSSSPKTNQQQTPELTFLPSPINGLSDAGFGSSSPYPPIGAQQQQRYSLPVQTSTAIPTFTQPFPSYQGGNPSISPSLAAASLRPQPTTSYNTPGQSKHLPEMHPSALEARPSISAPFPPSSSPPRNLKGGAVNNIAAPAAIQQRERPDASRPLGQEICLECLMRDRDMADVEVTGPGIWSRNSDIDFEEALRAEEIAINNAASNGGYHTGSSAEDGNEVDRRSYALHRNGSTEENYGVPMMNGHGQSSNGARYAVARDGGPIRSPSRESSVSDGQRGYRRQPPPPRRRLGSHDPLTSASLKLWTQMNHVSSAHRYKVLSDFVQEQTRLLEEERKAYEQSLADRDRVDRAMRDSPAKMSLETRSSFSSGMVAATNGGAASPRLLDMRRGNSKNRVPSMQLLPNGMTVETIDVQWDEKEAKARAKAAHKSRRASAHSPSEQRKSFAPSIKSFNALSTYNSQTDALPSPSGSFAPPWMADERRRFSSPMLSSRYRNASSDNLARNRQYAESGQDLRKSSYSMMTPPLRAMRSPSPSRQSFQTGTSQRESRGWRRSLWPRSASASVASFPRSGSMMEMHLGMSQDKHEPMPAGYPHDYRNPGGPGMHAPGGTWPDNASELGEPGGISADENVEAAKTKKQKKKRFQKLFNSLLGTHHHSSNKAAEGTKRVGNEGLAVDQYASHVQQPVVQDRDDRQQQQGQRRQTSLHYAAAAYQDDYSEPLAPPPPLSYLTGQQSHNRSYSTSSQSSVTPPGIPSQQHQDPNALYQNNTRPNSLTVPRNNTNSSNGFISPSTSSSDLNRNRPSSVTSWRSSSNKTTGSPQSPRELLAENFGHPLPAIRQASFEELAPGLQAVPSMDIMNEQNDMYKLRKEKSLPALPPGEYDGMHPPMPGQDYALQQHLPAVPYDQAPMRPGSNYGVPPVHPIGLSMHEYYGGNANDQYAHQFRSNGSEWDYGSQHRGQDYDAASGTAKAGSKKPKIRSRLFSFGAKKGRSSTSPPPPVQTNAPSGQQAAFSPKGFAPHETALQAVVRDQGDMVAYRYPSAATNA